MFFFIALKIYVITVLICAGVVSLAYYITVLLEKENRHSYFLEVSFDYGFFTLSSAGYCALKNNLWNQMLNLPVLQVQQLYLPQPAPCLKEWVDQNDGDLDLDTDVHDLHECVTAALCS